MNFTQEDIKRLEYYFDSKSEKVPSLPDVKTCAELKQVILETKTTSGVTLALYINVGQVWKKVADLT